MCPRPKVKPNILDEKWIVLGSVEQLEKWMKKNEWEKLTKKTFPRWYSPPKGLMQKT
jgi:hypothetical protein